jgi:hypothetical protein
VEENGTGKQGFDESNPYSESSLYIVPLSFDIY